MVALATATEPGPFRAGTIGMGRYFGLKTDDGRLMAMAGERMRLDGFVEVSAVCTWPEFRGRGLAKTLVSAVAAMIAAEGSVPFLHVKTENEGAIALYEKLGFRKRARLVFKVMKPLRWRGMQSAPARGEGAGRSVRWPAQAAMRLLLVSATWVSFLSVAISSLECRIKQGHRIFQTELLGPGFQRAVAGDLVVLDRLGGGDEAGVERLGALEVLDDGLAFLDDAEDGVAGLAAGGFADQFEHLLQALDMTFGLFEMLLEAGLQLGRLGRLGHLGQRLDDLLFGVIDVLEGIEEQVVERLFGSHVAPR